MPRHHGTIHQLTRAVLSSKPGKDQNQSVQALTEFITSTNPPPFTPRTPFTHESDTENGREQEELIQKIKRRSLDFLSSNGAPKQQQQHENHPISEQNQTYGETPATTIQTLLNVIYPNNTKANGSFLDGGSGAGIPTLAAALSNRFSLARGIEYQSKWHEQASALKTAFNEHKCIQSTEQYNTRLDYMCGDMTEPNCFAGASCVFLNAVVWDALLCQKVSERLEKDLDPYAVVVSMSRRLALPSFDLVDVLCLPANNGVFTFYLNQKTQSKPSSNRAQLSTLMRATSDSEQLKSLRESGSGMMEELLELCLGSALDQQISMPFLIALSTSEPTTRVMTSNSTIWSVITRSLDSNASLQSKALASMLLRSIVDHPTGRRSVNETTNLLLLIMNTIQNDEEHPAIRTNLLDVVGNLLHDSPLEKIARELDEFLECQSVMDTSSMTEARQEIVAIRRWWKGFPRELPIPASYIP